MNTAGRILGLAIVGGGVCLFAFEERTTWRYCRTCGTDAHSLEYRLGPVCLWHECETSPSHVLRDLLPSEHAHDWMTGGGTFGSVLCQAIG